MIRWLLFIAAAVTALMAYFGSVGRAHESGIVYAWIEENNFRNAAGTLCCREGYDCSAITDEQALLASVGSVVEVTVQGRTFNVLVNKVYPSLDPHGRPMACTTGCVFRNTMG